MRSAFYLFVFLFFSLVSFGQNKNKFSLEANYGLNGNFFVRSYDEVNVLPGYKVFYKKDFIGTIGGLEFKYGITAHSKLGIAYGRGINSKQIDFSGTSGNISLAINDFTIRHINNFYQLFYQRSFSKKNDDLKWDLGLLYLRMRQQEIELSPGGILFEERNYKNSKLEEGGAFFGIQYSRKIDKKFELGVKSRVYYLISTQAFEAITFTPALTYNF